MQFIPLVDMGAGILMYMYGTQAMMIWGVPAVLIEAVLLQQLLPTKMLRAVLESLSINVITTIAGYLTVYRAGLMLYQSAAHIVGKDFYYETGHHVTLYLLFLGITLCLLSALIEGLVLMRLEREIPKSRIWKSAVMINVASYVAGVAIVSVWLWSK